MFDPLFWGALAPKPSTKVGFCEKKKYFWKKSMAKQPDKEKKLFECKQNASFLAPGAPTTRKSREVDVVATLSSFNVQ